MPPCAVPGCQNFKEKGMKRGSVSFHKFPQDYESRCRWVNALNIPNLIPLPHTLLCSVHFREEDIDRSSPFRVYIKKDAVPSLFLSNSVIVPKRKRGRKCKTKNGNNKTKGKRGRKKKVDLKTSVKASQNSKTPEKGTRNHRTPAKVTRNCKTPEKVTPNSGTPVKASRNSKTPEKMASTSRSPVYVTSNSKITEEVTQNGKTQKVTPNHSPLINTNCLTDDLNFTKSNVKLIDNLASNFNSRSMKSPVFASPSIFINNNLKSSSACDLPAMKVLRFGNSISQSTLDLDDSLTEFTENILNNIHSGSSKPILKPSKEELEQMLIDSIIKLNEKTKCLETSEEEIKKLSNKMTKLRQKNKCLVKKVKNLKSIVTKLRDKNFYLL